MIENKLTTGSEQSTTTASSTVTSPISGGYKETTKKSNGFIAWLKDEETIDTEGTVTASSAATSYGKGLIEIAKTIYKKPILSALAITTGTVLTVTAQAATYTPIMSFCTVAGVAGITYAIKVIADKASNYTTKQAYELMGISSLVLALGICGLLL